MSVSPEYRAWVLDQLGRVLPVTSRTMFGGVGIYTGGLFFALMDDDTLYLKVDDSNRAAFEAIGCGPFRPYGDERAMQYYELPTELLEDSDVLRSWVDGAVAVARRAKNAKNAKRAKNGAKDAKGGKRAKDVQNARPAGSARSRRAQEADDH